LEAKHSTNDSSHPEGLRWLRHPPKCNFPPSSRCSYTAIRAFRVESHLAEYRPKGRYRWLAEEAPYLAHHRHYRRGRRPVRLRVRREAALSLMDRDDRHSGGSDRPQLTTGRTAETAGDSTMVISAGPISRALWIQLSDLASTSRPLQRNALDEGLLAMRKENAIHRPAHASQPYFRRLQPAPSHNKGEGPNLLTDLLTSKPEGT
jgi:hypothetical protein